MDAVDELVVDQLKNSNSLKYLDKTSARQGFITRHMTLIFGRSTVLAIIAPATVTGFCSLASPSTASPCHRSVCRQPWNHLTRPFSSIN
jgi:hypothetical protein